MSINPNAQRDALGVAFVACKFLKSSSAKTTASPLTFRFVSIQQMSKKGHVRVEVPVNVTARDGKIRTRVQELGDDSPMHDPGTSIVRFEANGHVVAVESGRDDIAASLAKSCIVNIRPFNHSRTVTYRVVIVVHRASCTSHHIKGMLRHIPSLETKSNYR